MKVFLVDRSGLSSDQHTSIKARLNELFQAVGSGTPARVPRDRTGVTIALGAAVGWSGQDQGFDGPPTDDDLVAYFLRARGESLIHSVARRRAIGVDGHGHPEGLTALIPQVSGSPWGFISEIYKMDVGRGNTRLLAHVAFHELMHNITRVGNAMHRPTLGLGAENVAAHSDLNQADRALLRRHLSASRHQYWDP